MTKDYLIRGVRLLVSVGVFAATGCDVERSMGSSGAELRLGASMGNTKGDNFIPLSLKENEALDRFAAALPARDRARARKFIADRIAEGHFLQVRNNAELQRLLDEVYAARIDAHKPKKSR